MERVRLKLSSILKEAQGGLSVRRFAKEMKVSHVTLMTWLEGSAFPSRQSLERIAKIRGQDVDELMAELNEAEKSDIKPTKAEDLLLMASNLSDLEVFRLATLLLDKVKPTILQTL